MRICYALCTLVRRWRKTEKPFSSLAYGQSLQQRSGKREEGNTLKIATQSVIKLFWRPKGLAYPLGEAPAKLRCTSSADMVTVSNPTPYFITLTDLKIGGKVVKNKMISPFDKYQFSLPKGAKNSSVTCRTINDYGAETPQLNCKS